MYQLSIFQRIIYELKQNNQAKATIKRIINMNLYFTLITMNIFSIVLVTFCLIMIFGTLIALKFGLKNLLQANNGEKNEIKSSNEIQSRKSDIKSKSSDNQQKYYQQSQKILLLYTIAQPCSCSSHSYQHPLNKINHCLATSAYTLLLQLTLQSTLQSTIFTAISECIINSLRIIAICFFIVILDYSLRCQYIPKSLQSSKSKLISYDNQTIEQQNIQNSIQKPHNKKQPQTNFSIIYQIIVTFLSVTALLASMTLVVLKSTIFPHSQLDILIILNTKSSKLLITILISLIMHQIFVVLIAFMIPLRHFITDWVANLTAQKGTKKNLQFTTTMAIFGDQSHSNLGKKLEQQNYMHSRISNLRYAEKQSNDFAINQVKNTQNRVNSARKTATYEFGNRCYKPYSDYKSKYQIKSPYQSVFRSKNCNKENEYEIPQFKDGQDRDIVPIQAQKQHSEQIKQLPPIKSQEQKENISQAKFENAELPDPTHIQHITYQQRYKNRKSKQNIKQASREKQNDHESWKVQNRISMQNNTIHEYKQCYPQKKTRNQRYKSRKRRSEVLQINQNNDSMNLETIDLTGSNKLSIQENQYEIQDLGVAKITENQRMSQKSGINSYKQRIEKKTIISRRKSQIISHSALKEPTMKIIRQEPIVYEQRNKDSVFCFEDFTKQ